METAKIEEKYEEKAPRAIFNDYHIDLKYDVHVSNWNEKQERLIKRITTKTIGTVLQRNQRLLPTTLLPTNSFVDLAGEGPDCFIASVSDHFNLRPPALENASTRRQMAERAAKGLNIGGKEKGEELEQELLSVKDETLEK